MQRIMKLFFSHETILTPSAGPIARLRAVRTVLSLQFFLFWNSFLMAEKPWIRITVQGNHVSLHIKCVEKINL